jgi:hypothetical protein
MTRRETEDLYRIEDGIIRSPGEFQGQALYIPHFWHRFMDGGGEGDLTAGGMACCAVTAAKAREFPELKVGQLVRFYEDETGCIREICDPRASRPFRGGQ